MALAVGGTHVTVAREGELVGLPSSSTVVLLIEGSVRLTRTALPVQRRGSAGVVKAPADTTKNGLASPGSAPGEDAPPDAAGSAGLSKLQIRESVVFEGPEVLRAPDQFAYFARDSLVFAPSKESLSYLPADWEFPRSQTFAPSKGVVDAAVTLEC